MLQLETKQNAMGGKKKKEEVFWFYRESNINQ